MTNRPEKMHYRETACGKPAHLLFSIWKVAEVTCQKCLGILSKKEKTE